MQVGEISVKVTADAKQYSAEMKAASATAVRTSQQMEASLAKASRNSQLALRNLGSQISDTMIQLTAGQNAFIVFGQQGSQAAFALAGMGGALGRVGAFLSGPFGAALISAISLVGLFATSAYEASRGNDAQEKSAKTLTEAIKELDDATGRSNLTQKESIELKKLETEALIKGELEKRRILKESLEFEQRKQELAKKAQVGFGDANSRLAFSVIGTDAAKKETGLRQEIAAIDDAIGKAQQRLATLNIPSMLEKIEAETDKVVAANMRYKDSITTITRLREAEAITEQEFIDRARKARDERDRALEKARDPKKEKALKEEEASARERLAELVALARLQLDNYNLNSIVTALPQAKPGDPTQIADVNAESTVSPRKDSVDAALKPYNDLQDRAKQFSSITEQALNSWAQGGQSLVDIFKNMIVQQLILAPLIKSISGSVGSFGASLFSGLGFADGGSPPIGKASLVGERGPELFVPNVAGTIVPNGASGGGQVINIDARGSDNPAATRELVALGIVQAMPFINKATYDNTTRKLFRAGRF